MSHQSRNQKHQNCLAGNFPFKVYVRARNLVNLHGLASLEKFMCSLLQSLCAHKKTLKNVVRAFPPNATSKVYVPSKTQGDTPVDHTKSPLPGTLGSATRPQDPLRAELCDGAKRGKLDGSGHVKRWPHADVAQRCPTKNKRHAASNVRHALHSEGTALH